MTRAEFADAVLTYCAFFRASETSGYRTVAHNADEGGVATSAHQFGLGRDVVYDVPHSTATRRDVAQRLGLRIIIEEDHDHLQPENWRAG